MVFPFVLVGRSFAVKVEIVYCSGVGVLQFFSQLLAKVSVLFFIAKKNMKEC